MLPLVPAAAMLGGVLLDQALPRTLEAAGSLGANSRRMRVFGLATLSTISMALLLAGLQCLFESGLFQGGVGFVPFVAVASARPLLGASLLVAGGCAAIAAFRRTAGAAAPAPRELGLPMAFTCAAVLVGLAGQDLATTAPGGMHGPHRLLNLFAYNYARSWPEALDFRGPLAAVTLLAVVACGLMLVPRWRAAAVLSLGAVAVLGCAFSLDVYLVRVSAHWSQRETIAEYYRARSNPDEPLVAYQMRWMGENFYTGNHLAIFVSSGRGFEAWIAQRRDQGQRVVFVTAEHSRMATLRRELGVVQKFELLTDKGQNDKFALARVTL